MNREINSEDLAALVYRSQKSALLLGEITGRLMIIIDECPNDKVQKDLIALMMHMQTTINKIYYNQGEDNE